MPKSNKFIAVCAFLFTLNSHGTYSKLLPNDLKLNEGLFKDVVDFFTAIDFTHHPHKIDPRHRKTTYDLIKEPGYVADTHTVTTEDRYILTVHRIPRRNNQQPKTNKPVVIFLHGMVSTSAFWVLYNDSLGFLLANEGYDVWMPNFRGNTYSRQHEFLDPDKDASRFWDFSFHEMGYYDMPAVIDYILAATGQQRVYCIGHSMGTTISYVLASTRPEYNSKIKVIFSLGSVAFPGNTINTFYMISKYIEPKLLNRALDNGFYELFPMNKWIDYIDRYICNNYTITSDICEEIVGRIVGVDQSQLRKGFLHRFLEYFPAGMSVKLRQHFTQICVANEFRQFNYGTVDNYVQYQHIFPPEYPLDKVTAPVLMFFGKGDFISVKQDVDTLFNKLPHIVAKIILKYEQFNHLDFLFGKDIKVLLYDYLIEILNRYRDMGHMDHTFLKQFNNTLTVI